MSDQEPLLTGEPRRQESERDSQPAVGNPEPRVELRPEAGSEQRLGHKPDSAEADNRSRTTPRPRADSARARPPASSSRGPRSAGASGSGERGGRPTRAGAPRPSATSASGDQRTVRPMGPRRAAPREPVVPDDVTGAELERAVRAELRSLSKANAEMVARHLVMIGRLLREDPETAYAHAMAAQRRAGRIAVVREAVGLAAYSAGLWSEALAELRAARRMSGSVHLLPLMADAERGLGRPERALELASSPDARDLATAERVELALVVSGARRDLGQPDAAVLALQIPELTAKQTHAFTPRLRYGYAEALLAAGRSDEALEWFAAAAATDDDGLTDADERLAELQGVHFEDLLDDEADQGDDQHDSSDGDSTLSTES